MNKQSIVFLIEPVYHGLQYVDILKNKGIKYVIVKRENGPYDLKDEDVIYDNLLDTDSIVNKIKEYLNNNSYKHIGILPGNDFCVPIAFSVSEKLGLKSNNKLAGIYSRNKEMMREQLSLHNISQPKSKSFSSIDEIKKEIFDFPVVVKPSDMTGSTNVQLVYSEIELIEIAEKILNLKDNVLGYPHNNIVLIEEFVKGPEFSTELFLENGELIFASVTEKLKGELPYFVEIGHVVPSSITTEEENNILIKAGYKAAKAIQIANGPVHAEMVLCNGIPKIIELTARIGGDNIMKLVKLATGVYIPELAVRQCLGEVIEKIEKKEGGAAIKFITSPSGQLKYFNIDELKKCKNVIEYNLNLSVGMQLKKLTCSDDRLGFIITIGKNGLEAKNNANQAAKKIILSVV